MDEIDEDARKVKIYSDTGSNDKSNEMLQNDNVSDNVMDNIVNKYVDTELGENIINQIDNEQSANHWTDECVNDICDKNSSLSEESLNNKSLTEQIGLSNRSSIITNNDTFIESKADNIYLSTENDQEEEDLRRFDVVSMINTLLDEDSNDSTNVEKSRNSRNFIDNSINSPFINSNIFSNSSQMPIDENYSSNQCSDFEYRNYRPPSQVKVQINCNGQQTVTSASLQDFRRLIGLKDYPRKSYNHAHRRNSRGYDYRNGFSNEVNNIPRAQGDCATRFAYRFGRNICDELKQCLLSLRKITKNREQCEAWIALRPWMPRNSGPCSMNTPSESCCMIDWLVFEFLKEYCNTNGVLKCLDQVWGAVTEDVAMSLMKEWFEHIKMVDRHRRAGFCDCSSQRLTVSPEKALQLLRNLNIITMNVDQFLTKMVEVLKPDVLPGNSLFHRKIN